MTRSLRYLFLLLFIGVANISLAQSGALSGIVKEKKGNNEPVIGAVVEVLQAGTVRGGAVTDEDGKYLIKPLNPATNFEVRVKYASFKEIRMNNVQITADRTTNLDFKMEENTKELNEVVITTYKAPLIKKDEPGSSTTITSDKIEKLPTRNTSDAASLSAGAYQQKSGAAVSLSGARSSGTLYVIDGVQVNGASGTNLPPNSVDQISVMTSGIPAKFGDATGGVINITTKGPSATTRGSFGIEHSVDGYGHTLAYFNLGGPLVKKITNTGAKKPVLGYTLSGQYLYDLDNNPSFYKNYVVKADKLKQMQDNPLVFTASSTGATVVHYASEYLRMSDLETRRARVNADYNNARIVGKLDYQLSDQMNIVFGGNASYISQKGYSRAYTLMSPQGIPTSTNFTGRGFIRFTQRFGKSIAALESGEKDTKKPLISNAYYSLQADYQIDYSSSQDPNHKRNAFNYGYVGKFDVVTRPFYFPSVDDSTGRTMIRLFTYDLPVSVDYTRSEMNPLLANYTSQIYNYLGDNKPRTLNTLPQYFALRNGDAPGSVYGLWWNTGNSQTGYSYNNTEQFSFNVDASFDFQPKKTRHQIEYGLYYQQRSERYYSIGASSLWSRARLLTNRHISNLDLDNPIYIINGQHYSYDQIKNGSVLPGPNDTVTYERYFDTATQSAFDYNLRSKLGLNPYGKDYLNIDNMDPSTFSVSMFSPDELINSGNPVASWYGYDYAGNRLNGQVNFNDWFTKKDARGNYQRQIGAFRPNYIAGYIMDKFELPNNAMFNIGLRMERFDANTKVLYDPYSVYATHTVKTSHAKNPYLDIGQKAPDNIGENYVVYVTSNSAQQPTVVGYRNGEDWYDAHGKYVSDPTTLGGSELQPELQKYGTNGDKIYTMKDSAYNPSTSFTDYTPQVNLSPRISYTFPIADKAMFYAHYDILVQRPKSIGEIFATPLDYYYINQSSNGIIPNPNLKPERMFDYEVGFQQELTRHSAVTINAYYKERKDMIQVRPYLYAWPNTYYTFGNRDFSTTKGFILKYDLRRTNHISMLLSYNLQFAEGSGSSSASSNGGSSGFVGAQGLMQNLISAGLPNLRFGFPLDIDSRHNFTADIDYRYEKGEGPLWGKHHILENAGVNFIFRTRSGEPYTRYLYVDSKVVSGGPMGSRLPWHYMLDLKVDKDFDLPWAKKLGADGKMVPRFGMNAFVYVTNVLNTKDILGVNGFTGKPDDDGYLTSAQGMLETSIKVSPDSYKELYSLSRQSPGFINNPRRVVIGIQVSF